MNALVERRIEEAIARGDFDKLLGASRPLALDEDLLVPEDMRVATRILKNAGYVLPGAQRLNEINRLLSVIERDAVGAGENWQTAHRLRALLVQLELSGRSATVQRAWVR